MSPKSRRMWMRLGPALLFMWVGIESPFPAGAHQAGQPQKLPLTTLTLPSGKKLQVEVARNEIERSIGMMWRTSLRPRAGMLFVFEDQAQQSFWMKNTLVDLDMIFIDRNKRITGIAADVPRSAPDTPDSRVAVRQGLARFVLELPAGAAARYGLRAGQRLRFDPTRLSPQRGQLRSLDGK